MSLDQFTQEQLQEMSLIDMAYEILESKKQAVSFKEILDEITEALGLTEEEVRAGIAQFYTDLNIDGRFMALGENRWGLRIWYPVDQTEEENVTHVKSKAKKKKAKKVVDHEDDHDNDDHDTLDEDDLEDFDEDEEDVVDKDDFDEDEDDDDLEVDDDVFDEDDDDLLDDEDDEDDDLDEVDESDKEDEDDNL